MRQYVFRGTLDQCLDRLRRESRSSILGFIEFVGVRADTASMWLLGVAPRPPAGEFWVRSVLFFELIGWKVVESEVADPLALDLARLWMYRIMTPEDIKEEIGYNSSSNTGLLEYIYGRRQPTKSVRRLISILVEANHVKIEKREAAYRSRYRIGSAGKSELPPGDTVEQLAAMLIAAQPLAERVASNAYSDEDRERLRELVGLEAYVKLAVLLNAMKSYRTRAAAKKAGEIS